MVPDTDLQLRVVIKALKEVVAEAVDPKNPVAVEQLRASIATLELIKARHKFEGRRARQELENAIALARAVAKAAEDASLAEPIVQAERFDSGADVEQTDSCRRNLLAAVSDAVNRAAGGTASRAVAEAVIAASKPQFDLTRAWYLPAGLEPDPGDVPLLEDLLARK